MNPNALRNDNELLVALECPECGQTTVKTRLVPHTFTYGRGAEAIEVTATLPVRTCTSCEFEYLDKEGQDAQHEAICRQLGVLTPAKIRALRENYLGLSRADLARLTGLGEATIARWERGSLIQNVANDRYLRLLAYEENLRRLREWADGGTSLPQSTRGTRQPIQFQVLTEDRIALLRVEQASFQLCKG